MPMAIWQKILFFWLLDQTIFSRDSVSKKVISTFFEVSFRNRNICLRSSKSGLSKNYIILLNIILYVINKKLKICTKSTFPAFFNGVYHFLVKFTIFSRYYVHIWDQSIFFSILKMLIQILSYWLFFFLYWLDRNSKIRTKHG